MTASLSPERPPSTSKYGAGKDAFGTHYHDLTALAEHLDRVRNVHAIEAKGGGGEPVQTVFDPGSGEFRTGRTASTVRIPDTEFEFDNQS